MEKLLQTKYERVAISVAKIEIENPEEMETKDSTKYLKVFL